LKFEFFLGQTYTNYKKSPNQHGIRIKIKLDCGVDEGIIGTIRKFWKWGFARATNATWIRAWIGRY